MKHNGKKVNFSEDAMKQVDRANHYLSQIEKGIKNKYLEDYDKEYFISLCDDLEACLEHLKSEVINND